MVYTLLATGAGLELGRVIQKVNAKGRTQYWRALMLLSEGYRAHETLEDAKEWVTEQVVELFGKMTEHGS